VEGADGVGQRVGELPGLQRALANLTDIVGFAGEDGAVFLIKGDVVAFVNLHRPSQGGCCGSSGFLLHPPEPEQSLAVVTDRRGECGGPAAAGELLLTLRTGRVDAPMLAPAKPRWAQLR
jgi:hypothetical protein